MLENRIALWAEPDNGHEYHLSYYPIHDHRYHSFSQLILTSLAQYLNFAANSQNLGFPRIPSSVESQVSVCISFQTWSGWQTALERTRRLCKLSNKGYSTGGHFFNSTQRLYFYIGFHSYFSHNHRMIFPISNQRIPECGFAKWCLPLHNDDNFTRILFHKFVHLQLLYMY